MTWAPTDRVRRTFLSVFPHVVALADIYVGSDQPIRLDPAGDHGKGISRAPVLR